MSTKPKLLFLVAEDWYFCSHRLALAVASKNAGYDVSVATRVSQHADLIRDSGLKLIPLEKMRRLRIHPFRELASILELLFIYQRERPDLVHHVGLKPVLYGSMVALAVNTKGIVNALAGLGFVFTSKQFFAVFLRPVIKFMFSRLLGRKNAYVIVQNQRDREVMTNEIGLNSSRVQVIRGAGVDLSLYEESSSPINPPIVVLIARMLWDKGIGDFVEAAIRIRDAGMQVRFVLVGAPDPENPTSLPESQLRAWHEDGKIEWWGFRSDVPAVLSMASIACLPTYYGEGVPKALIEAMASSRPIVTTNVPGCRELVESGACGILVPPRDVSALSAAIESLIRNPIRCQEMGRLGRLSVRQFLSLEHVINQTLSLYENLLIRGATE
jgi:glycosyltransferase involved in cell wall biosynthesis